MTQDELFAVAFKPIRCPLAYAVPKWPPVSRGEVGQVPCTSYYPSNHRILHPPNVLHLSSIGLLDNLRPPFRALAFPAYPILYAPNSVIVISTSFTLPTIFFPLLQSSVGKMLCEACFRMLRGQGGRIWKGTFDLHFNHHDNGKDLIDSARMHCGICRVLYEELQSKFDDTIVIEDQPLSIAASLSVIDHPRVQHLYRLDFKLRCGRIRGRRTFVLKRTGEFFFNKLDA